MKIINIDVKDEIILKNIEDVDTGEITGISSKVIIPTGNYNNIILNFNFNNAKLCEDMDMFANFSIIDGESVDVALEKITVKDKVCQYACFIPAEVFVDECEFLLGLYGYSLNEDGSLKQRVSFQTVKNSVVQGTYDPDANEGIVPSPSVFEVYFNKITDAENKFNEFLEDVTRVPLCFDNVETMKNSDILIEGNYSKTEGYYEKNDGGSGLYKIRSKQETDVEDNGLIHFLANDLVAELVREDYITPELFGAKGNGIADDIIPLQKAFDYCKTNKIPFRAFKNYKISEPIVFSGDYLEVDMSGSIIYYEGTESAIVITRARDSNYRFGRVIANNGTGIEFRSDASDNYCQYVNLYFKIIQSKEKCIWFNKTAGWLNEIRIFDGMLNRGNYGIYADNGSETLEYTSSINNITVQNVGIEGVTTGFYLANSICSWNIINIRYHEAFTYLFETVGVVHRINLIGTGVFVLSDNIFSKYTSMNLYTPIYNDKLGSIKDTSGKIIKGCLMCTNYRGYMNLSTAEEFDTRERQVSGAHMSYGFFYCGNKLKKLILSDAYGNSGINEFYIECGFENNSPFEIYHNDTLIFNDTSNVAWKKLRFIYDGYQWRYEVTALKVQVQQS